MFLPEVIRTDDDLRIVATIMKQEGITVPIKGYKIKNGKRVGTTYAYATANADGDDILLETHNVKDAAIAIFDIYAQIVEHIRKVRKSA